MASTINPKVSATPTCVIAPWLVSLMMMAPVPAKTSANVPSNSAKHRFMGKHISDDNGETMEILSKLEVPAFLDRRWPLSYARRMAKQPETDPTAQTPSHGVGNEPGQTLIA